MIIFKHIIEHMFKIECSSTFLAAYDCLKGCIFYVEELQLCPALKLLECVWLTNQHDIFYSFLMFSRSPTLWLVEYYSSWCGHCQEFAPIFKALAKDIAG